MTRILLLEDDNLQAQLVKMTIEQEINSAEVEIISTELAFRTKMDDIVAHPPDVIVLDVMVRWRRPSREKQEKAPGEYFRAGIRCWTLLKERGVASAVIVYTVLESADLKPKVSLDAINWKDVVVISKEDNFARLLNAIKKHLPQPSA